jgi:hypothetical protein
VVGFAQKAGLVGTSLTKITARVVVPVRDERPGFRSCFDEIVKKQVVSIDSRLAVS